MINQCKSCGGFCKKSGCERANVKPASSMTRTELIADLRLNHEYCPKEVILRAADMLDAGGRYVAIDCPQCGFEGAREHAGSEQQAVIASLERDHQALSNDIDDYQNTIAKQRKVLEQALEALKLCSETISIEQIYERGKAITAIQEVLSK